MGKKILDVGAGEIPFNPFYNSFTLDVKTCDIQQNSKNTIDVIIPTDGSLPFAASKFDVILLMDVLEHVENDQKLISECERILTKGGIVIGNVPFLYRFHEEPYDYRRYTPSGLKLLFEKSENFQVIKIKPLGSHYFVAERILSEINFKVGGIKRLYLALLRFILRFGPSKDISFNSPFSYFFIIKKLNKLK